jgi:protocatechuate 4,5-dioxygenase beta chain
MVPMMTMWPGVKEWPIRAVPIAVNTVQHPIPSAARCYNLGKALGTAIESYPDDLNVVILGTGGMSHQLQGERAGFINKRFDTMFMQKVVDDPETLARMSNAELVEQAGSEGVELIMWLAMRGAMTRGASVVHSHYHIPVSNTAAGVLVLENMAPVLATV